jgi:predicted Co/Zn/Cd cation transporter (cation efflux family)
MPPKQPLKAKRTTVKARKEINFPLEKINFLILGLGIIVIFAGYVCMSENSVFGFLPTVVSPILLVLGYCVIIPIGILKKSKKEIISVKENLASENTEKITSNIKTT